MRVTAETKNATRARILAVAEGQFAEHGFEATTTRDIAAAAKIATGTLFNYFATKESIVEWLVNEASAQVAKSYAAIESKAETNGEAGTSASDKSATLEEALFEHIALTLRKLKPYRKYLPVVLETSFSPLSLNERGDCRSMRDLHLETVSGIVGRHGVGESFSAVAAQLYWTLYLGVLTYWSQDRSRKQEDTLALMDESLNMFVGWLAGAAPEAVEPQRETKRKRG